MIRVIAARLERLSFRALNEILNPVSQWFERMESRLYADAASALPGLWNAVIEALSFGDGERSNRRLSQSWAEIALNAPVGRLVLFVMKDPAKAGLSPGQGYPTHWTTRLEQLLSLPGDLRREALVMICYQLNWLFTIDPAWTERQLLPAAEESGPDADAFWEGLWGGRVPQIKLFARLKSGLLALAGEESSRQPPSNIIAATLLTAWGDVAQNPQLISDLELREVLICCGDSLRRQIVHLVERWSSDATSPMRERIIPFFRNVWPKQRALRTSAISAQLVDIAFASGDLMPDIVKLILPRLVPVRSPFFQRLLSLSDSNHPVQNYPRETLDLLWAVLSDDPRTWPHNIGEVFEALGDASETSTDLRLSELRRRRAIAW